MRQRAQKVTLCLFVEVMSTEIGGCSARVSERILWDWFRILELCWRVFEILRLFKGEEVFQWIG